MMSKYSRSIEKNFLIVITIIFTLLTFYLIKDIIALLIFSMILAYFLYPLYKKYLQKINNERISAILTLLTSIFVIFIPVILIAYFFALKLFKIIVNYKEYIENPEILNLAISNFLNELTNSSLFMTIDFSGIVTMCVTFILNVSKNIFSSIPVIFAYFFVVLFITYYILIYNKYIFKIVNEYLPLNIRKQNQITNHIEKNLKTLFRGYFLTGIIQTLVAFIGYWIFGAPNLLIITFLTFFASLIPYLGTPLVWLPVSIYLMFIGSQFGGIGLLIYGTFVISLVDNFLRPILMSDKDTISPPLVFIGFIGGLLAFGIVGIILGPLIISTTAILLKYVKEAYDT